MWSKGNVLIDCVESTQNTGNSFSKLSLIDRESGVRMAGSKVWERNGALYFEVVAPSTTIIHNEQGPITLEKGTYRIWEQGQYAPCACGD